MSEVTVKDLFYELTKEQMEALCPPDLRVIIRKAFDNRRPGLGPGPTMQEVIDHYNDERNYWVIRNVTDDSIIHDALDRILVVRAGGGAGALHWLLPSIVESIPRLNAVGSFDLAWGRDQFPPLDKILTDAGW